MQSEQADYVSTLIIVLGIPFALISVGLDMASKNYVTGMLMLLLLLLLLVSFFVRSRIKDQGAKYLFNRRLFFLFFLILGAILAFLIGVKGNLSRVPWFYIFPLIAFHAVGHKRGAIWISLLMGVILLFWFLFPTPAVLSVDQLKTRFIISAVVIAIITFLGERGRFLQQEKLIHHQETLLDSDRKLRLVNDQLKSEVKQRKQTEEELLSYKNQLEKLVDARTAELEDANRKLIAEIKDREQLSLQQMKLEEELRQSHKMEAIGTLSGGIAHDFNNLLATMMGYSELLLPMLGRDSTEKDYLEEIYKAGERAAELTSQILTFSRVGKPDHEPLLVEPVLNDVIKMVRATLPATVDIQTAMDVDGTIGILGNSTQIHQVILNLCSNAAHAMKDSGGILDIRLSVTDTAAGGIQLPSPTGQYLKMTVRDSGPGIPADLKNRIFDPFFTTKKPGEGTGLGLSIVQGIVEGHHGKILVESEPGCGAAFHVYFPTHEVVHPASSGIEETAPSRSVHILVVDDEASLANMYRISLQKMGYQVTLALNGAEALERFLAQPDAFDLVLTDQIMPKMTGIELIRGIKELRHDLPIILATGHYAAMADQTAESLGISNLVLKPVKSRHLVKLINDALRG